MHRPSESKAPSSSRKRVREFPSRSETSRRMLLQSSAPDDVRCPPAVPCHLPSSLRWNTYDRRLQTSLSLSCVLRSLEATYVPQRIAGKHRACAASLLQHLHKLHGRCGLLATGTRRSAETVLYAFPSARRCTID